jgi:cardiolipin synthase
MTAIETTSLRGIDVRIITPHIPDKKLIFKMTQSSYKRLMEAGVKIYEYTPGFIHTKSYQADGQVAIIGTINLDYRSLVHNFENGVWMYNHEVIKDIEKDFLETQKISMRVEKKDVKDNIIWRFFRGIVKIFAPLM